MVLTPGATLPRPADPVDEVLHLGAAVQCLVNQAPGSSSPLTSPSPSPRRRAGARGASSTEAADRPVVRIALGNRHHLVPTGLPGQGHGRGGEDAADSLPAILATDVQVIELHRPRVPHSGVCGYVALYGP
jgi:hypothetical protein